MINMREPFNFAGSSQWYDSTLFVMWEKRFGGGVDMISIDDLILCEKYDNNEVSMVLKFLLFEFAYPNFI